MNMIEERSKKITEEILIQEQDLQTVLDSLGMSIEEAKKEIETIFFNGNPEETRYIIHNKNTLQVYVNRTINHRIWSVV